MSVEDEISREQMQISIKTVKISGDVLESAFKQVMKMHEKNRTTGKQSLKNLVKKGDSLERVEINDEKIKAFEKIAKKHGVDFSLKKDVSTPNNYVVLFKSKHRELIQLTMNEFIVTSVKGREDKDKDILSNESDKLNQNSIQPPKGKVIPTEDKNQRKSIYKKMEANKSKIGKKVIDKVKSKERIASR